MTPALIGGIGTTELLLILFFMGVMAAGAIVAVVVIVRVLSRSGRSPQG